MSSALDRHAVIAIIGDRNERNVTHRKTEAALSDFGVSFTWVGTDSILPDPGARLVPFAGMLVAPGSPYRNAEGALAAIRHGRENAVPLLGTCGGFQHILLEFVRDVVGVADADHAETNPQARHLAVTPLTCSLAGQNRPVFPVPGSRAAEIYGVESYVEPFFCNYGLNPDYLPAIEAKGLRVSGKGEDGQVRIMELAGHPFFFGALFVPQAGSTIERPNPLLTAFVAAVRARVTA